MQTGILKKINLLVEMAESTINADTLKAELREIDTEIEDLKEELISLRESRETEKYFKVSEKQIDENNKVSSETKIKKQERAIKKLQKEIDSVVLEEANLHETISKLNEEIRLSNEYVDILNNRLKTIKDNSTKEYYKSVLDAENKKIRELEEKREIANIEEKEKLNNLNYLNLAMEEMNKKLESEKARLAETKANLGSQLSYIDEELKEQDDKRISELQKKIMELEKRRLEIITDPAMIASEAKEFIVKDDHVNALAKIQELVTIVKSKPYMDIPSSNELTTMLEEEEDAATTARDEYASLIDTKNYSSGDSEVIEERISFLNTVIASLEDKIKLAKDEIDSIDNIEFKNLSNHLNNTIDVYNQLQGELAEYKIIIETENEDKTPKRRAILAAAYERKQKELEDVENIIEHYKADQKVLITKAYLLETENINKYEKEINSHKQEIREMEFLLENVSKAKDVLAIENDKQKLKDLDSAVKNIKHRQKYGQTPSEIYDEIEISLGTSSISNDYSYDEPLAYEDTNEPENNIEISTDEISFDDVLTELPTEDVLEPTIDTIDSDLELDVPIETIDGNDFLIGNYDEQQENKEIDNE